MKNLIFPILYSPRWPWIARGVAAFLLLIFVAGGWLAAGVFDEVADGPLRYALGFIAVQAAVLTVLTVGLLVSKAVSKSRERSSARTRERIERLLADALVGSGAGREELMAACERHSQEAQTVLAAAFQSLRGQVRQGAVDVFVDSGLYERLLGEVMSPDPGRALDSIALVREVDRDDGRQAVRRALLSQRYPIVQLAARVAILKNGTDAAKREVLETLGALPFWQRLALCHFAPSDPEMIRGFLGESLGSEDEELVLGALEFVLTRQRAFPMPVEQVGRLRETNNTEIRIKLYKALPYLCDAAQAARLIEYGLVDPDWRVRSMAARASGALRVRQTRERLFEMVKGASSMVEVAHAARAMMAVGGDTASDLLQLMEANPGERSAVVAEVLSEGRAPHPGASPVTGGGVR